MSILKYIYELILQYPCDIVIQLDRGKMQLLWHCYSPVNSIIIYGYKHISYALSLQ